MFANGLYDTSKIRYPNILANSTLIILFSEMLKFSQKKNFIKKKFHKKKFHNFFFHMLL